MTKSFDNRRRSIRLPEFDYTKLSTFFITICACNRRQIFSRVSDGELTLKPIGMIVREEWWRTEVIRENVCLDVFILMPNHFHAIFHVTKQMIDHNAVGAHCNAPLHRPAKSLGSLIGLFKGSVTRRVRRKLSDPNFTVWQRNYYERVIRDELELNKFREYIIQNPLRWELDLYYSPN